MARAKKLPSGFWRALAYSHTDSDGKRHYESFTAETKAEAEMKAAEFAAHRTNCCFNNEKLPIQLPRPTYSLSVDLYNVMAYNYLVFLCGIDLSAVFL